MAKFDFIKVIPAEKGLDGFWAVIEGRNGKPEIIDDLFSTFEEAENEGKAWRDYKEQSAREQRQEYAMEAGRLHGVDAYNDAMGY